MATKKFNSHRIKFSLFWLIWKSNYAFRAYWVFVAACCPIQCVSNSPHIHLLFSNILMTGVIWRKVLTIFEIPPKWILVRVKNQCGDDIFGCGKFKKLIRIHFTWIDVLALTVHFFARNDFWWHFTFTHFF